MAQPSYYENYPPQQSVTFHDLQPGIKYRVRVRAVDGEGNVGPYSAPVDIIAGLGATAQPSAAVSGLTVKDYPLGVEVTWNAQAGAAGYELYATKGSTPPDPDPSDRAHLHYRGNATKTVIKAQNNDTVKVKLVWYDQFGRKSTGIAAGYGQALDAEGN